MTVLQTSKPSKMIEAAVRHQNQSLIDRMSDHEDSEVDMKQLLQQQTNMLVELTKTSMIIMYSLLTSQTFFDLIYRQFSFIESLQPDN